MNTHETSLPTIAAIATAHGTGGIAVIRLSGPESWHIAETLCPSNDPLQHGQVSHRWLSDPTDSSLIDEVLVLAFKAPRSFTGEDCIELHCHGGLALTQLVLKLCLNAGAIMASAGEFSKRAVLNGRIDLSQAESILDLIHAEGEAIIKATVQNLRNNTHAVWVEETAEIIRNVQADMVASIDFPDEVEEPSRSDLIQPLLALKNTLLAQITQQKTQNLLRSGIKIAILGQPNAGKSSLFNCLLASDRAIVTEFAGTTRDVLHEKFTLKGIPVTLLDTAGLRNDSKDPIEQLGIERSWQASEAAALVLYVIDGCKGFKNDYSNDFETLQTLKNTVKTGLILLNKQDSPDFKPFPANLNPDWPVLNFSAKAPQNLSELLLWLESVISEQIPTEGIALLLSEREHSLLEAVTEDISQCIETLSNPSVPLDLSTVPLTDALLGLQAMLGRDTNELVLDSVFARFCVGK